MNLRIIGTGSSGNCYVLEHEGSKIILDAGVTFKTLKQALDFDLSGIEAVLCTHRHQDHVKGLADIQRAGFPVWMPRAVDDGEEPLHFNGWIIKPFDLVHDTEVNNGFLIYCTGNGSKMVYMTDTGYTAYLPYEVHHLIIECNYIDEILDHNRINLGEERYWRTKQYHFSLARVLDYLNALNRDKLKSITLVHLSDDNSDAERMKAAVKELTGITPYIAETGMNINLDGGTQE